MSTVRQRIRFAFIANGIGRVMRVAEQLALVPLLLLGWGVERYGEWIALYSIAVFAALAHPGIGVAAYSDIVIQFAGGNQRAAVRSFTTAIVLMVVTVAAGFGLLLVAINTLDIGRFVSHQTITPAEARTIIAILGLAVLLQFGTEPLAGVLSAAVGAGLPNLVFGCTKAIEIAVIAGALYAGATPLAVATITLAAVLLHIAIDAVLAVRYAPWLRMRWQDFDTSAIRRTWRPALGHFCLFVTFNIVNVHVPRLIVSYYLGAATLTIFTVFVTYTRASRNLAHMLSQAVQVEIGRAFAGGHAARGRALIEAMLGSALGIAIALLALELVLAPLVIPAWTQGHVAVAWGLLAALVLPTIAGAYFDAMLQAASALNRVGFIASCFTLGAAVGLAAGILLLPTLGLIAIAAITLLMPELAGSWAATRTINSIVGHPHIRLTALSFWPAQVVTRDFANPPDPR